MAVLPNKMTPVFFLTLALLFAGGVAPLALAASEEEKAILAIQKKYEETKSFRAGFVQKSYVKMMNQTVEALGEVEIKKPGRMKWVYSAPDPQVLVSDQKTLWLYLPDDNQVTKMTLESIYSSNAPALFLAGRGKLTDTFDVVRVVKEGAETTLVLAPKKADDTLEKLLLHAENKSFQIVGSTVYDKLGNRTEMRFQNIQVNLDIPDSTFRFELPAGAELLDYTGNP
jgi:outer membrane lipoprotein carrier protein